MNWKNLSFGYQRTNSNVRTIYRDGQWQDPELTGSETITLHMAATSLHYGQEIFEGLKAFQGKDGRIRLFRWEENAKRFRHSARGLLMAEVPDALFREAVFSVIRANREFVPPYFKEGFKPVNMMICREYDRAAPHGTGTFKAGGNYAAGLRAVEKAHEQGFSNVIFLDAKEKKYIDECGPANFFGIKDNTYITPESPSILDSITNKSLMQLAAGMGMKTERRKVPVEELGEFEEAGACGTAAVISPIHEVYDPQEDITYVIGDGTPGPVSTKLYEHLTAIQLGDEPDQHGWVTIVD